ncbi:MAG: hypothetical protein H6819_05540 [Phycisphaerales bacterium]|nr:hypothetical protein [Phycisphaerales bacterium]MCB9854757.1 hypothetical protein [Phycisphaerales bacterium]MCB9863771.1 hypothetical protein [Phycisphaerales bacterium]
MIISPQDACLDCGYSLEGLPRPHRCPECGLAFDDDTVVFRRRRTWWASATAVIAQTYVLQMFIQHWSWVVARVGLIGAIISFAALAVLVLLAAVTTFRSLRECPGFAALTIDDLVIQLPRQHRIVRVAYRRIKSFSISDWAPWVEAEEDDADGGTKRPTIQHAKLAGIFDGKSEKQVFTRMLTERMQRNSTGGHTTGGENSIAQP